MGERKHKMRIYSYSAEYKGSSASDSEFLVDVEMNAEMSINEYQKYFGSGSNTYLLSECSIVNKDLVSSNENKERKTGIFGGYYTLLDGKDVYITKVIYNKPVVVVFWSDGIKTRSTCDKEDVWNPEFGLTLCIMKRFLSNKQLNMLYRDWFIEESYTHNLTRTLKDIRKENRMKSLI